MLGPRLLSKLRIEVYQAHLLGIVVDTGYKGFMANEFQPLRDPLTSLREAVALCDV